jgi:G3E family GTPase
MEKTTAMVDEPSALEQGLASPAPAASFVSFVVVASFDAGRARVEQFFASLPETIMRAKGFMTIDGQAHLVQFAGGRLELEAAANPRSLSMVFISSGEPERAAIEAAFRATAKT